MHTLITSFLNIGWFYKSEDPAGAHTTNLFGNIDVCNVALEMLMHDAVCNVNIVFEQQYGSTYIHIKHYVNNYV